MNDAPPVPILVVDDNPAKRLALTSVLASQGYDIVEADSGLGALRCVMAQNFAVILLDVCMPIMDGFETAGLIRQRQQSEMTPIIFITSFERNEISTDLYAEGAVDFMFAPIPPEELRAKVSVFAKLFVQAAELAQQRSELEKLNQELTTIARRDLLTGLGNRRALQEDLEVLDARVNRYGYSYCMALFDVDEFKAYNDTYGHPAGDQILEIVAATLQSEDRAGDSLYRYGGEEFLCVLPEQSMASGHRVIDRMRGSVEQLAIPNLSASHGVLTVSAGIAVLDVSCSRPGTEVLEEADQALYRAKQQGRNRVECGTVADTGAPEPRVGEPAPALRVAEIDDRSSPQDSPDRAASALGSVTTTG